MIEKVCVVTEATTSIKYSTALELARRGATVVLLCQNHKRGESGS